MNCFNCKKVGVKENEFCPHCGALVPRRNADVAKYADFQLDGKSTTGRQSISNKSEVYESPIQKWLTIWRDIQKEISEQSYKGQGSNTAPQSYGMPDKTRQNQNTYNTAFEEPKYRQATGRPVPRKRTTTKKPSFPLGIVTFIVIFAVTIILPYVLGNIDFDEYQDNVFNVTIDSVGDTFFSFDYTLTDFEINNFAIKNDKIIAFDMLFEYPTPFAKGSEYSSTQPLTGEIEVLGEGHYPAILNESGIHVQKCDFELDTGITFLSASFYNEKEGFSYNYYFSKTYSDGITIVFAKDGSYAID